MVFLDEFGFFDDAGVGVCEVGFGEGFPFSVGEGVVV